MLRSEPTVAHYVTHFFAKRGNDLWLVFHDEGASLQQFLYAVRWSADSTTDQHTAVLEPSMFWRRMRSTQEGLGVMKAMLHQAIRALANLHARGIMHRDVKPSNLLINAQVCTQ
jgi:serine/threonine protein kinase